MADESADEGVSHALGAAAEAEGTDDTSAEVQPWTSAALGVWARPNAELQAAKRACMQLFHTLSHIFIHQTCNRCVFI